MSDILGDQKGEEQADASQRVREANSALHSLRRGILQPDERRKDSARICSRPFADRTDVGSSLMPSISESPLEQDFTIKGVPSKLGCPFAGMASKRLSSHAASVLSRYKDGSVGGAGSSTRSVSRIDGRESFAKKCRRQSSFADPIKAEICGLSDHDEEPPCSERAMNDNFTTQQETHAEVGVCPIRFLDQHSPEEVATYFERHKHELPRSHEVCVKRYQSNEKQIQELDAKYGNLVSMIQGLGVKHKDMLPKEPEEGEAEDAKVRKWASSVTAEQAVHSDTEEEERQPHFERPLRDIRVGESPSRPWGIPVPAEYLERVEREERSGDAIDVPANGRPAQCPFGFGKDGLSMPAEATTAQPREKVIKPEHVASDPKPGVEQQTPANVKGNVQEEGARMVFTGPVFIGYSAEDAAKFMRECGLSTR